jgi:hypothetical protein
MDGTLKTEIRKNNQTIQQISDLKAGISSAGEWRNPNTLIHMSGYADIGYSSVNINPEV